MIVDVYLLSMIIVAAGFAAGILPFFFHWTHVTAHRWIAFGAGTILGVAFIHMIPQAFEMAGAKSLTAMLFGFLTLYLLELASLDHPHDEAKGEFHEIGILALIGIAIHDLVDGVALGSGHHLPELTPAIFVALALHKIPTMFALSLLMVHGGFRRAKIIVSISAVLLAIPLGVFLAGLLVGRLGESPEIPIGYLISYSAGTFFYIGAYELLPEMHRQSGPESRVGLFFILGLATMAALKLVHPVI